MLYNEENRNGRWYRGETISSEERESWYPAPEEKPEPEPELEPEPIPSEPGTGSADDGTAPQQTPHGANEYFRPAAPRSAPHRPRKSLRIAGIILLCLCLSASYTTSLLADIRSLSDDTDSASFSVRSGDDSADSYAPDVQTFFEDFYTSSSSVEIPRTTAAPGTALTFQQTPAHSLAMSDIYELVNPAVVGILCYLNGAQYSWGTGVLFTPDGYLITNAHVLQGADSAEVIFSDESRYSALLIGSDSTTDIAVLKIDGHDLPYAAFADSDCCKVGESVVAIGNPLGMNYSGTMTQGIISAIDRSMTNNGYPVTLLQTDAALNEGNSGGPLINSFGQVIGITSMKIMYTYSSSVEGIGFAIPTSVIQPVVDELLQTGHVSGRPTLGIVAGSIPTEAKTQYSLPDGIYVSEVDERSDAWTQGLRAGDVITAVEGIPVTTVSEVNAIKSDYAVGDCITVSVWRDGRSFDITFALIDSADLQ